MKKQFCMVMITTLCLTNLKADIRKIDPTYADLSTTRYLDSTIRGLLKSPSVDKEATWINYLSDAKFEPKEHKEAFLYALKGIVQEEILRSWSNKRQIVLSRLVKIIQAISDGEEKSALESLRKGLPLPPSLTQRALLVGSIVALITTAYYLYNELREPATNE